MKIKVYAPQVPDSELGLFFEHEQICPLCRSARTNNGTTLNPHPDCYNGKELNLRSKQRFSEIVRKRLGEDVT